MAITVVTRARGVQTVAVTAIQMATAKLAFQGITMIQLNASVLKIRTTAKIAMPLWNARQEVAEKSAALKYILYVKHVGVMVSAKDAYLPTLSPILAFASLQQLPQLPQQRLVLHLRSQQLQQRPLLPLQRLLQRLRLQLQPRLLRRKDQQAPYVLKVLNAALGRAKLDAAQSALLVLQIAILAASVESTGPSVHLVKNTTRLRRAARCVPLEVWRCLVRQIYAPHARQMILPTTLLRVMQARAPLWLH